MKKNVLEVLNEKGEVCYGWGKFNDVGDVWECIGWLCNTSSTVIKITYLEYYSNHWDTFDDYIEKIKINKGVVARLEFNNCKFTIELEEVNE